MSEPQQPDEERMKAARRRAQWELGDPGWADVIVRAYLDPERSDEYLRRTKEEDR